MQSASRQRMPGRARPETAARAGAARWSPESRAAEAIRILVAQAPELSEDQRDQLRALLSGPAKAAGER